MFALDFMATRMYTVICKIILGNVCMDLLLIELYFSLFIAVLEELITSNMRMKLTFLKKLMKM